MNPALRKEHGRIKQRVIEARLGVRLPDGFVEDLSRRVQLSSPRARLEIQTFLVLSGQAAVARRRRQLEELEREISFEPPRPMSRLQQDDLLSADRIERDPGGRKRILAVAEVLRNLPTSDYKKLAALAEGCRFVFNTNGNDLAGFAHALYGDTIYVFLAATLERCSEAERLFTVAHEIAHVCLGHVFEARDDARKEREADAQARRWGYREY